MDPKDIADLISEDPDVFDEAKWGWKMRGEDPPPRRPRPGSSRYERHKARLERDVENVDRGKRALFDDDDDDDDDDDTGTVDLSKVFRQRSGDFVDDLLRQQKRANAARARRGQQEAFTPSDIADLISEDPDVVMEVDEHNRTVDLLVKELDSTIPWPEYDKYYDNDDDPSVSRWNINILRKDLVEWGGLLKKMIEAFPLDWWKDVAYQRMINAYGKTTDTTNVTDWIEQVDAMVEDKMYKLRRLIKLVFKSIQLELKEMDNNPKYNKTLTLLRYDPLLELVRLLKSLLNV